MRWNEVGLTTWMTHRLRLSLAPILVVGLAWVGTAAASSDEPPAPQEPVAQEVAQDDPDDEEAQKDGADKLGSVIGDDDEHAGEGHDRLHWGPLYPSITVVSSGAGLGPELQFWMADLGGSPLDIHASGIYSYRQYQFYTAQFGLLPQRPGGPPSFSTSTNSVYPLAQIEKLSGAENHFVLYASYRYRDYPEEDFYGIGLDALRENHSGFGMRDHLLEAVTGYHFSPRFAVNFRVGLLETTLVPGADEGLPQVAMRFDSFTAPGFGSRLDELVLTAGAIADLRDVRGNPHKGALLMAAVSRFEDRDGGPFEFTRATADARVYVPLFSRKHVLAARGLLSADWPDDGSRVPFYLQSTLGGSRMLRGYPSFRFRDDAVAAFSVEYRFEPIRRLELAVFYDAGTVAESISAVDFSEMKTAWGGGIRIKSKTRTLLRFDVARGREGTRYLVKTSAAF